MIPQLSMKPLQLPSFTLIGTMVIELREFNDKKKKKNMDKINAKTIFCYNLDKKCGNLM